MKRTYILFGLVMMIGLVGVVFISAIMISKPYGNYEVSVDLVKGWNLIAGTMPEQGISADSEIQLSDIKAMWYYSPIMKKYYQIYPKNELDDLPVEIGRQLDEDVILTSAMWIYSEKEGEIKYDTLEDYLPLNNRQLYSGWNFVTITPDMIGKTLNEIKGDCDIIKVAGWDTGTMEWDVPTETQLEKKLFIENSIFEPGRGFVVKVSSDCTLGTSTSGTSPPGLPGTECTDSDGGKDYDVKGTVSGLIGDEQFTLTDECDLGTTQVAEYYCEGNQIKSDEHECTNGCSNGVCI